MKSAILLLAVSVAALSSCTTAYKTGQTPDDVYFSPAAAPQDEYVQVNNRDDRRSRSNQEYYDDRYLRMKVQNRQLWSELDDYYYYNTGYNYSTYNNWNNPWSPSVFWNAYYNPYCYSCCSYSYTKNPIATGKPRIFNLNSYNSASLTNHNYNSGRYGLNNSNSRANSTPRTNGNFLRDLFNNNNNNNNNSSSSPRTSGSSSSSSSGSSSSSSSAPVRRF